MLLIYILKTRPAFSIGLKTNKDASYDVTAAELRQLVRLYLSSPTRAEASFGLRPRLRLLFPVE